MKINELLSEFEYHPSEEVAMTYFQKMRDMLKGASCNTGILDTVKNRQCSSAYAAIQAAFDKDLSSAFSHTWTFLDAGLNRDRLLTFNEYVYLCSIMQAVGLDLHLTKEQSW